MSRRVYESRRPIDPEPLELFLVVYYERATGFSTKDVYPGEDAQFRPHEPGDGRLVIQRNDRREPASVYGRWTKYQWEMLTRSEAAEYRNDVRLPGIRKR